MPWVPSTNTDIEDWEIICDELITADGFTVAALQCFEGNDETFYVNAIDPEGKAHRAVMGDYGEAKKWAEITTGLRPRLPTGAEQGA